MRELALEEEELAEGGQRGVTSLRTWKQDLRITHLFGLKLGRSGAEPG